MPMEKPEFRQNKKWLFEDKNKSIPAEQRYADRMKAIKK